MLNFYLKGDDLIIPEYSDEFRHVGGIDIEEYHRLIKKGIIEAAYSYFDDWSWDSLFVREKYEKVKQIYNGKKGDTDLTSIFQILSQAVELKMGLLASCD